MAEVQPAWYKDPINLVPIGCTVVGLMTMALYDHLPENGPWFQGDNLDAPIVQEVELDSTGQLIYK